jgi:hypothetical protein
MALMVEEFASNDDAMMMLAFGSFNPPIARFPHVITKAELASLRAVLDTVGRLGGIFGDSPLVDRSGVPYLEPEDGHILNDFLLWELPENQRYLFDRGCYAKLDSFTAVIDTRTSADLVSILYSLFSSGISDTESIFFHDNCIERIARAIPALGWAYIPLSDETGYAMFVVAAEHDDWVASFESRLKEFGLIGFRLVSGHDRFHWPDQQE